MFDQFCTCIECDCETMITVDSETYVSDGLCFECDSAICAGPTVPAAA